MSVYLCIETSGKTASVALVHKGVAISVLYSDQQKEHAAFLQPAIHELLLQNRLNIRDVDAIAVSNGPGSYTGLRVGMASAKGLCYTLQKPLICLGTLHIMAVAARHQLGQTIKPDQLFIPMIDARRNEVFTAVFDKGLKMLSPPHALILDTQAFHAYQFYPVCFFGDGSVKWQTQCTHPHAQFFHLSWSASDMGMLAHAAYETKAFASLSDAVPVYGKEFYSPRSSVY